MIYQKAIRLIAGIVLVAVPGILRAQAESNLSQQSVLSTGRWIKIKVDRTDVYRISHATLREWGFDNPDRVIVAGYGSVERAHTLESAPDDLPTVPVLRSTDAIYFYGEGDTRIVPGYGYEPTEHRNLYSTGSYYFVTESATLTTPEITNIPVPAPNSGTGGDDDEEWSVWDYPEELDAPDTHIVVDRRRYRDHHPFGSSAFWFSANIASPSYKATETWDIADFASAGKFSYQVVGMPGDTNRYPQDVEFGTDAAVSAVNLSGLKGTSSSNVIYVAGPLNTYSFQKGTADSFKATIGQTSGDMDFCSVNHMTLSYNAWNRWTAPAAVWDFIGKSSADAIVIDGLPETERIHVWDVTDPRAVMELEQSQVSAGRTAVPANPLNRSWQRVCVFAESASIPEPEAVGEIANQNLHALPGADLLIVATEAAYPAALRLAEAHRSLQGLEVAVVKQNDVYNEFSSGSFHPNAIRHLVMMLAKRADRPLRHLLLMGLGTGKPLANGVECPFNRLATYHTEEVEEDRWNSRNNISDSYFTILSERIGPSICDPDYRLTINVGRAPVSSPAQADDFADKCIEYLSNPFKAGVFGETSLLGCQGDKNQHLSNILRQENVLRANIANPTVHHVHNTAFPVSKNQNQLMIDAFALSMGAGTSMFNYSGHSGNNGFGPLGIITIQEVKGIKFNTYPIVLLSSCSTSEFDFDSAMIGIQMALSRRGPIAVIGAAREVYMANNHNLNNAFIDILTTAGPDATIGDIFTGACNRSHGSSAVTGAREQVINNACYNLLGNPALPLYVPSERIVVEEIGGNPVSDEAPATVAARRPVVISGSVRTADGNVDASFNGTLHVSVYAPEYIRYAESSDRTDKEDDAANGKKALRIGDSELYAAAVSVESGRWQMTYVPEPSDAEGVNRISLHAVSDTRAIAGGTSMAMIVADDGTGHEWADTQGPKAEIWLDMPGCGDGAVTGPSPLLHITLSDDESGLRLNRSTVGGAPSILLDGTPLENAACLFTPNTDGTAEMEMTLNGLTDGLHTLEVSASDIAGNRTSEIFRFTARDEFNVALEVAETLVRDCADFEVKTTSDYTGARILIRDSHGNTVFSRSDVQFPYAWDLLDNEGRKVADGLYRASVMLEAAPRYSSSPEVEFTVVKPIAE